MDILQGLLKILDVANPVAGVAAEFLASKLGLSDKTVQAVQQTISGFKGEDVAKLQQIASDLQDHLAQYNVQLQIEGMKDDAAQVDAVNKTLQTEAMGGSWLQRNHHAIESLATVGLVWGIYFALPMLKLPVPPVPESAWITLGAILGVTAWQRGQVNKAIASQG